MVEAVRDYGGEVPLSELRWVLSTVCVRVVEGVGQQAANGFTAGQTSAHAVTLQGEGKATRQVTAQLHGVALSLPPARV